MIKLSAMDLYITGIFAKNNAGGIKKVFSSEYDDLSARYRLYV